MEPSWWWSYGSRIYNYLCNQCLSPLTLWVRNPLSRGVFDTTLCDIVCQWLETGRWFTPVVSTNKTDRHDITEILLKVALSTITLTLNPVYSVYIKSTRQWRYSVHIYIHFYKRLWENNNNSVISFWYCLSLYFTVD